MSESGRYTDEIDPGAWYIFDFDRDAVVSGPHDKQSDAAAKAQLERISYIAINGAALESIQRDIRLLWEIEDVDILTDGGADMDDTDRVVICSVCNHRATNVALLDTIEGKKNRLYCDSHTDRAEMMDCFIKWLTDAEDLAQYSLNPDTDDDVDLPGRGARCERDKSTAIDRNGGSP